MKLKKLAAVHGYEVEAGDGCLKLRRRVNGTDVTITMPAGPNAPEQEDRLKKQIVKLIASHLGWPEE
ncbi:MAG: hypothetical protein XD69_0181 [Clostridia bacterium 62_21]|nr:MAG: hypothetical protein XD69_0181 [Clostridia bacterium 62_21]HAG07066.1 hypothetical protein [Peptococcaceae bacterium]